MAEHHQPGHKENDLRASWLNGRMLLEQMSGSTISTLLHDKINPKDSQVLSLGDSGFLQFYRVVSSDYGKPRMLLGFFSSGKPSFPSTGRISISKGSVLL